MSLYHCSFKMSFSKSVCFFGALLFLNCSVTAEDFTGRPGDVITHTWIDLNVTNGVPDACGVEGRFHGSIARGAALHRLFAEFGIDTTGSRFLYNLPFDDVSYYHEYMADIAYAYNNYIISGTDNSRLFNPDCYVIRVEFVKMVLHTIGVSLDRSLYPRDPPFPDMESSAWYYDYIRAAYNLEIIQGTDENPSRLMPNLPLSETEYSLIVERAKRYYKQMPKGSYFDGAGSLIQPDQDCWGCSYDEAVMQPHTGAASTVVFQWKQDEDSQNCRYLKIETPVGFKAVVTTKSWSWDQSDGHSYSVTLPVTIPNSATFTTTSVTSMQELSTARTIKASCSSSDSDAGNRITLPAPMLEVTFPHGEGRYVWAGNGSIISGNATDCTDGFGCIRDDAIALDDKSALTAFQWQASSSCKTLKIFQTGEDGGFSGHLKYKPYDSSEWIDQGYVSFPQYINGTEGWFYVISVETLDGMIKKGEYIRAECVELPVNRDDMYF